MAPRKRSRKGKTGSTPVPKYARYVLKSRADWTAEADKNIWARSIVFSSKSVVVRTYSQYRVVRAGVMVGPGFHGYMVMRIGSSGLPATTESLLEAQDAVYFNTSVTPSWSHLRVPEQATAKYWQAVSINSGVDTEFVFSLQATSWPSLYTRYPAIMMVAEIELRGALSEDQTVPVPPSLMTEEELVEQLRRLRAGDRWSDLPAPSPRERSTSRTRGESSSASVLGGRRVP